MNKTPLICQHQKARLSEEESGKADWFTGNHMSDPTPIPSLSGQERANCGSQKRPQERKKRFEGVGRKENNGIHVTKSRREDLLGKRKRISKGESGETGECSRGGAE